MSRDSSSHWVLAAFGLAILGCGAEPGESISGARFAVIGGVPAPEATNIVMVYDQTDGTTCSGALIAPNVVLASRTCVSDDPTSGDCTGTLGAVHAASKVLVDNEQETFSGTTPWTVQNIAVPVEDSLCGNSIALLILSDVVDGSDAVPLAPRLDGPVTVGETFTAYGYGATTVGGADMGTRNKRDGVPVTCVGDCAGAGPSEWGGGLGACVGDGPAVGVDKLLIGLATRGSADCESMIFEGLDVHADWLRDQVASAAATGGYMPPSWVGGTDGGTGGASGGGGEAGSGATGGAAGTGGGTAGTAGTAGAGTGGGLAGGSGNPPASTKADDDDGGCSCAVRSAGTAPWFLLVAVAALVTFRRRSSPRSGLARKLRP